MHDADRVSSRQGAGDLRAKIKNFANFIDALRMRSSSVWPSMNSIAIKFPDRVRLFIDVRDVGMIESGGGRRFLVRTGVFDPDQH